MKVTLDHNCIIDLLKGNVTGVKIKTLISSGTCDCYVVDIGASEMHERGVRPDRYDLFDQLLSSAGIAHLPRLSPMFIPDVTFLDKSIAACGEMIALANKIEDILFGNVPQTAGVKWQNRLCDVHTMWCHIQNGNQVFLTSDKNFMKQTKFQRLLDLGAGRICRPTGLNTSDKMIHFV